MTLYQKREFVFHTVLIISLQAADLSDKLKIKSKVPFSSFSFIV